ncbi:SDR family NAD(P)-dependent oxidoreductase [Nocardia yamanashiensis]|uniref:oxidoreductase n=1 Tax=Nocardia yamanashiensis TaxID=209247 RepID=UPI001E2E3AFF|nr:oxidoreductase [Nocardia yamanashiensis]UGT44472.1 SDR family NAD(P)-dependent oxidoreductase [Nocardia yamanashiensis]
MTNSRWTARDLPRMDGQTVIVTGANSGLGLVTTRELARVGAHVVLAVRDVRRGEAAAREVEGSTEVRELDLADLASIRAFAEGWTEPVAALVNNAGIMMVPHGHTADGFERQFGTNHLGHFALTNLLLPRITDRVVTVSSQAHRRGSIDLNDLNWKARPYNTVAAYGQSKLANLLFTLELSRRLEAAGSKVRATAAHPGWSATNLQSHTENRVADLAMRIGNLVLAQRPEAGARPTLYALSRDIPSDSYVGPDGFYEYRGHPKLVGRSAAASDAATARKLWEASEELTGIRFPLPAN